MENKASYIDHFFEQQLGHLESEPASMSKDAIFKHLDHTAHPIDHTLNKHFSNYDTPAPELDIEKHLSGSLPLIDLALYHRLREFEEAPEQVFDFSQLDQTKKKKRSIIFFWMVTLLLISSSLIAIFRFENQGNAQEQNTETTKTTTDNHASGPINNEPFSHGESPSTQRTLILKKMVKTAKTATLSENSEVAFTEVSNAFENEGEKNLLLMIWSKFDVNITTEAKQTVAKKTTQYRPGLKPFPFQIHFQAGIQNETGIKTSIESRNQHKDAEELFKRSTGKHRSGSSYSLGIERRLGLRWQLSTGITYSSNSSKSSIDYYYTDLPVYDTTGQLQGYFTRPRTASNHTTSEVSNTSQTLAIPVSINYRLLSFKRMSFWTGATAQLALKREIEGQYFNFKTEQLQTLRSTFNKGLIPGILLGCRYPISSTWMFSTQVQLRWQRLNYTINETIIKSDEILPSFNIGLIYTPYYKIK